jgi:hypothetical protein
LQGKGAKKRGSVSHTTTPVLSDKASNPTIESPGREQYLAYSSREARTIGCFLKVLSVFSYTLNCREKSRRKIPNGSFGTEGY